MTPKRDLSRFDLWHVLVEWWRVAVPFPEDPTGEGLYRALSAMMAFNNTFVAHA